MHVIIPLLLFNLYIRSLPAVNTVEILDGHLHVSDKEVRLAVDLEVAPGSSRDPLSVNIDLEGDERSVHSLNFVSGGGVKARGGGGSLSLQTTTTELGSSQGESLDLLVP